MYGFYNYLYESITTIDRPTIITEHQCKYIITKASLLSLAARMDARMEGVEKKLDKLDTKIE